MKTMKGRTSVLVWPQGAQGVSSLPDIEEQKLFRSRSEETPKKRSLKRSLKRSVSNKFHHLPVSF